MGVPVGVGVGEAVRVGVGVCVAVGEGVGVCVAVGAGIGEGVGVTHVISTVLLSTLAPVAAWVTSA